MHKATFGISVTAPSVEFPVHAAPLRPGCLSWMAASASENKERGDCLELRDRWSVSLENYILRSINWGLIFAESKFRSGNSEREKKAPPLGEKLVGCLVVWFHCLVGCLIGWLVGWLSVWLTGIWFLIWSGSW